MSNFFLSTTIHSSTSTAEQNTSGDFGALWVEQGTSSVNGALIGSGVGAYLRTGDRIKAAPDSNARLVQFWLSRTMPKNDDASSTLLSKQITINSDKVLLRLDEVKFPPGATAFRHIHPGAGIRYLSHGQLEIISDDHRETAEAGHIWFEPANSPVRAVASMNYPSTSFVRFMVLPVEYAGKSTIQILNADDAAKPRLQVTHRHFDKIVQVAPG